MQSCYNKFQVLFIKRINDKYHYKINQKVDFFSWHHTTYTLLKY